MGQVAKLGKKTMDTTNMVTAATTAEPEKMDIPALTKQMNDFVKLKGWYEQNSTRPQTPRNIATSLVLEASEVLEHFQWTEKINHKEELASELADVALYLLQLASICDIDLESAITTKLRANYLRQWDEPWEPLGTYEPTKK